VNNMRDYYYRVFVGGCFYMNVYLLLY